MLIDKRSKSIESCTEMGGYFGLDLPDYGDPFPNALKFQSGRAALRAVLECAGIKRVMLPAYICGAVIQAVVDAGGIVENYFLDDSLYPRNLPDTFSDEHALLYVNYFGLCQENVARLLQRITSRQLIIDNCQALFAPPSDVIATVYSPRKFVGVPDGGLLVTNSMQITNPKPEDVASIERMRHLLLRMAYSAQYGYCDYVKSEKTLNNTKPLGMSHLTKRILNSIDMTMVKLQRRENYLTLANCLDKYNLHRWKLDSESVPMCYPLVLDRDVKKLKKILVGKDIYIPTYWPSAGTKVLSDRIEHRLINCCLAVPCDQRYSDSQMSHLANKIVSSLNIKSG